MPKEPNTLKSTGRLLSGEERGWTFELDAAIRGLGGTSSNNNRNKNRRGGTVETRPTTGTTSDFELACHAIVGKEDIDLSVRRIQRMKEFRTMYNIQNDSSVTVFQAIQCIHKFFHAYPNFIQAIGTDVYDRTTVYIQLSALSKHPPFNHTEDDRWTALYYILHAMQPDFDSVRKGTVWIGDMDNANTRTTFPFQLFLQGGRALLKDSYPIKVKDLPCLCSPGRFSPVWAFVWPFLSTKMSHRYVAVTPGQLQGHFPKTLLSKQLGGTISQRDVLDYLEENLRKRFENEESFRL